MGRPVAIVGTGHSKFGVRNDVTLRSSHGRL